MLDRLDWVRHGRPVVPSSCWRRRWRRRRLAEAAPRRVLIVLTAALLAVALSAAAAEPRSMLTEDMLSWYREDESCIGRAYVSIQTALEIEAGAAQAAARRRLSDAEPLAARIAADYNRA